MDKDLLIHYDIKAYTANIILIEYTSMIYIIGGPPRCGKTSAALILAKKTRAVYLPVNYFRTVLLPFLSPSCLQKKFPVFCIKQRLQYNNDIIFSHYSADELVRAYRTQARAVWPSIMTCMQKALRDEVSIVFEGYQLEPDYLAEFLKHNSHACQYIRIVFLYRNDHNAIRNGLKKGCAQTDWILKNTKQPETLEKVSAFISSYSEQLQKAAHAHGFTTYNTERHFHWRIRRAVRYLINGA